MILAILLLRMLETSTCVVYKTEPHSQQMMNEKMWMDLSLSPKIETQGIPCMILNHFYINLICSCYFGKYTRA